jgi:hypothetical protein
MTQDELIAVIEQGLEADERAARAASPNPWKDPDELDGAEALLFTREDAYHIYRHDPARVLADVQAKREVVRLCRDTLDMIEMLNGNGIEAKAHEVAAESYLNVIREFARPYLEQDTP